MYACRWAGFLAHRLTGTGSLTHLSCIAASQSHHPDPRGSSPLSSEPAPRLQHAVSLRGAPYMGSSRPRHRLIIFFICLSLSQCHHQRYPHRQQGRLHAAHQLVSSVCARWFACFMWKRGSRLSTPPPVFAATKPGMSTTTSHMSCPLSSWTSPPLSHSSESIRGTQKGLGRGLARFMYRCYIPIVFAHPPPQVL